MKQAVNEMEEEWGHGSYRDALTTVDDHGKRLWVYAKKIRGKWWLRRNIVNYILLVAFLLAPFIKVHGHQFILLDVVDRKFIIFGSVFWPADFYLFVIGFISFIVFIFLFTSIFGRLWCGWACPQTIFMEMVFRKIEYLFEGDAAAQRRLSKMEWNTEKTIKRGGKYAVFYLIAFMISSVFLAYLMGGDELLKIAKEPVSHHIGGLASLMVFSGVFFFVYAYMREQVCTIVCPYGRLQSVLLDDRSLIVAYNYKRGETREKWGRHRSEKAGDCIDCGQCVDVCPTGIDIRNGLQMECINCTACIDACDSVMKKIGKPDNLIKMASIKGIENNEKFHWNARRIIYSVLLVAMVGVEVFLLQGRPEVQADILHVPGMESTTTDHGTIKNIYNIRVLNKTFKAVPISVRLIPEHAGVITNIGTPLIAPGEDYAEGVLSIEINKDQLHAGLNPIKIGVYDSAGKKIQTVKTNFMTPQL